MQNRSIVQNANGPISSTNPLDVHDNNNQIPGSAALAKALVVAGIDDSGNVRALNTDINGHLQITINIQVQYALQVDDAGSGVTYVGEAIPGSLTSAGVWRIKKIVTTGPDVAVTWAGGTSSFDKIWDNRLGLSYS